MQLMKYNLWGLGNGEECPSIKVVIKFNGSLSLTLDGPRPVVFSVLWSCVYQLNNILNRNKLCSNVNLFNSITKCSLGTCNT